jgi:putative IMPACT (imprinted ancient) family translation regulator
MRRFPSSAKKLPNIFYTVFACNQYRCSEDGIMGGPKPNDITTNTREMRAAVNQAVDKLATASPESINEIVHDIDKQVLQHQYQTVIDPLFGDPNTHQSGYTKAFTSLLNQRLQERGILPQVLMTFGENKDNYMALSSGEKYIRNDTLELAEADYDQSHSYVEALLARDMQTNKGALERSKRNGFGVGAIRLGNKEGISPARFEAYAKQTNDVVSAKNMLQQLDSPDAFNRLSRYKSGGTYVDLSDIQTMLEQNQSSLSSDQVKALQYMELNFDKIAVKGVDALDSHKRGITRRSMERFAAKHHATWGEIHNEESRETEEQSILDASLLPQKSWSLQDKDGTWKHPADDGWSDEYPDP